MPPLASKTPPPETTSFCFVRIFASYTTEGYGREPDVSVLQLCERTTFQVGDGLSTERFLKRWRKQHGGATCCSSACWRPTAVLSHGQQGCTHLELKPVQQLSWTELLRTESRKTAAPCDTMFLRSPTSEHRHP